VATDLRNVRAVPKYLSKGLWNDDDEGEIATEESWELEPAEISIELSACNLLETSGSASGKSPAELQLANAARRCRELPDIFSGSWWQLGSCLAAFNCPQPCTGHTEEQAGVNTRTRSSATASVLDPARIVQ
jgi:hypothetical protein